jgi:hypothetical protein
MVAIIKSNLPSALDPQLWNSRTWIVGSRLGNGVIIVEPGTGLPRFVCAWLGSTKRADPSISRTEYRVGSISCVTHSVRDFAGRPMSSSSRAGTVARSIQQNRIIFQRNGRTNCQMQDVPRQTHIPDIPVNTQWPQLVLLQ